MHAMNDRRGFTLVEVIVILAVLSILAAVAIPMALRIFESAAEEGTRDELQKLKEAMIGNPDRLRNGVRSDFAFLGDLGRLPTNLDEILNKGALPAFSFDSPKQAGAGWNGPYITGSFAGEGPEDFKNDQLGNAYVYSDVDFVNGDGEQADGKITSAGPDGTISTADDIVIEILKRETEATLRGIVKDSGGNPLASVDVDLNFPSNGILSTVTATTDAAGNYTFTSVPFGPRSVKAKPRLVLSPGTVAQGGGGKDISFRVLNYSESAYTISAIRVDFDPVADNYDEIKINGSNVDSGNNFTSGQDVTVTATAIAASPATRPSVRVFNESPDTQLPDISISGQGTAADIEINNFNKGVRGTTMKVTFNPNGASSVVAFLVP